MGAALHKRRATGHGAWRIDERSRSVEKGLATIFQTRGRHVTLKTLEVSVRFVRPDVALAHVKNELSGLISPDGQTLPPHQELSVRVFVKTTARGALLRFTTLSCSVSDDT